MPKVHNKLVRDKIPQMLAAKGLKSTTRSLDDDEYRHELLKKLIEEATELLEDPSIEERADVEEVLRAIDTLFSFDTEQIEAERQRKHDERGGFADRIFLKKVSDE